MELLRLQSITQSEILNQIQVKAEAGHVFVLYIFQLNNLLNRKQTIVLKRRPQEVLVNRFWLHQLDCFKHLTIKEIEVQVFSKLLQEVTQLSTSDYDDWKSTVD
ncbi:CLUMA_CG016854, isoform A [Clunio marinus]|uniref:CLUMA_CG016854, isoform A n=1 Tax=Clunio marinus TaxID=568069 RepID=A0A1J1IX00_9DIPT|nr:CLUMA_CG016854, isoform A [Clunio marinus]